MTETVFGRARLNFCRTRASGCGIVTLRSGGLNGVVGIRWRMLIDGLGYLLVSCLLIFE
jgi:hypothetical protein